MADSSDLVSYEDQEKQEQTKTKLISAELNTTSYFKDFLLRDPLTKSISDVQFEHPSEVQQLCIPKAILGIDILSQAKSGTGKTAVFVLSTLQQIQLPCKKSVLIVVLVHTKEMAVQVKNEYSRFLTHFDSNVTIGEFYGGTSIHDSIQTLKANPPNVFIGTVGRTLDLLENSFVDFSSVKHFVIDEVDHIIGDLKMRHSLQKIFYFTPVNKQTMMFTATLNKEMKDTCLLFLKDPFIACIDEEKKLRLRGINQQYIDIAKKVSDDDKRKMDTAKFTTLSSLIDETEFSQMVIFVRDKNRARRLCELLKKVAFPSIDIHSGMTTKIRMERFNDFKNMKCRILVTTNLLARGIDVQDVNLVINYDMAESSETYLHRVGRAGRFETNGIAVSFIENETDRNVLKDIQSRFEANIEEINLSK